jgi:hypothetical protein
MIETRIYVGDTYQAVRARTLNGLFRRIAKAYGGNGALGRLDGWNSEGQIYRLTICRSLPRRYGRCSEILREITIMVPAGAA